MSALTRFFLILLPVVGILFISSNGLAQNEERSEFSANIEHVANEMSLSDSQRQQIRAISEKMQPLISQSMDSVKVAHKRLEELLIAENSPKAELIAANDSVISARTTLFRLRFERLLAIRNTLNKNQVKDFIGLVEKLRRNHYHHDESKLTK